MNILQRIVLIVGAVALLIMLGNVESHQHLLQAGFPPTYQNIWDWQAAIVRAVIISAATAAIYFAVGKRRQ